jgi:hypothetical protein
LVRNWTCGGDSRCRTARTASANKPATCTFRCHRQRRKTSTTTRRGLRKIETARKKCSLETAKQTGTERTNFSYRTLRGDAWFTSLLRLAARVVAMRCHRVSAAVEVSTKKFSNSFSAADAAIRRAFPSRRARRFDADPGRPLPAARGRSP